MQTQVLQKILKIKYFGKISYQPYSPSLQQSSRKGLTRRVNTYKMYRYGAHFLPGTPPKASCSKCKSLNCLYASNITETYSFTVLKKSHHRV
jgi:hypothetical protein